MSENSGKLRLDITIALNTHQAYLKKLRSPCLVFELRSKLYVVIPNESFDNMDLYQRVVNRKIHGKVYYKLAPIGYGLNMIQLIDKLINHIAFSVLYSKQKMTLIEAVAQLHSDYEKVYTLLYGGIQVKMDELKEQNKTPIVFIPKEYL